jgi:hypothetical protein
MLRDVEVEEFSALMPEHDEDEEQAEGEGRNEEEVDRNHVTHMSGKKGHDMRVIRRSSVRVGEGRANTTAGGDRGVRALSGPLLRGG